MRKSIAMAVVMLTALVVRAEAPFVDEPFDQALKDAGTANKLVMIDFFATWCAPCKAMDKNTWPDKSVQAWVGDHAVALRLDADKSQNITDKYKVEDFPCVLFIKPDGTEAGRISGYVEPKEFLAKANDIIAKTGQASK